MPPRQKSLTKGGWRAIALSLLLHAAIISAAVFSWFTWKHSAPEPETMAIQGSVVDERTLAAPPTPAPQPPAPEPVPEPAPVEEQGPPKPDPAEIERKKEEERVAQEKLEQQKLEQEKIEQKKRADKLEDQKQAQQLKEREDAERLEAEKQAEKKAAADKALADKAMADKKAADRKRADDAAAAKKAADEKAKVAREAELRQSLEAEERANAASTSTEANLWHAQIVARITRAWIKPPSAQPGISCSVSVTQVLGGDVTAVRVNSCSGGDAALRESVEAAVLRASPLPTPPPGVPFERSLELTFAPQ